MNVSKGTLRFIDATSCAETNGTIFDLVREVLHAGAKNYRFSRAKKMFW